MMTATAIAAAGVVVAAVSASLIVLLLLRHSTTLHRSHYSILQSIKCEHIPTEPKREHNAYGQQTHGANAHMVTDVQEQQQETSVPFKNTDYDQTSARNGNGFIEVKPVVKSDPDGYDGNMDGTRHWDVGPGGVLKEITSEQTHSYLTQH